MAGEVMMSDEQLITDREVARILSVDPSTVWRWQAAKRIPQPVIQQPRFSRWSKIEVQEHVQKMIAEQRKEEAS